MMRRLLPFLYAEQPVEFESRFGFEESVRRLASATGRTVLSALTRQMAVGRVTAERVCLQRAIPFVGNSFKPFFVGRFVERDGRAILTGQFQVSRWTRAFMTFWFGFCIVWTALALIPLLMMDPDTWWFPFAGLAMFILGSIFVRTAQWFSRNDPEWLRRCIAEALGSGPPNKPLQPIARENARSG